MGRVIQVLVLAILACVPAEGDKGGGPAIHGFTTIAYNRTAKATVWSRFPLEEAAACESETEGIPAVFHRSHRFAFAELESLVGHSARDRSWSIPESLLRVRRNLDSCAAMNPEAVTKYYDDAQVEAVLDALYVYLQEGAQTEVAEIVGACIARLRTDAVLKEVFVLRSDFFRLAILFLEGGWWIDSDVVCIDPLGPTLELVLAEEQRQAGCILAWEGAITDASAPLNWAMGCRRTHPFILEALELSARNVVAWRRPDEGGAVPTHPEFCAQVTADDASAAAPAAPPHAPPGGWPCLSCS